MVKGDTQMKCYRCNGSGVDDDRLICYRCGGSGVIEMTNEEYLRSAGTDGLTAIFMQFMFDAEFKARFVNGNFITEFRKWLKEIHT